MGSDDVELSQKKRPRGTFLLVGRSREDHISGPLGGTNNFSWSWYKTSVLRQPMKPCHIIISIKPVFLCKLKKKKNSNHAKIKSANVSLLFEVLSFLCIHFFNSFKTSVRSHREHGFTISRLKKKLYHF